MRKRRTWLLLMGGLLFSALCVIAAGVLLLVDVRGSLSLPEMLYLRVWLAGYEADLARPAGSDATPVIFRVEPGDNAAAIGAKLAAQGLITDADLFRNYARYHGLDTQFEAGTYFLRATQALPDIALTLTDSSRASVTIQVIDGWRREEIAASIDANPLLAFSGQDFLAATGPGATLPTGFADYVALPAGASLEGFLFPDTYFLPPDVDAAAVRDTLLQTFVERVPPTLKQAAVSAGLSLTEVVTLASIVTREAVHADEQPLIASVYLNRLAIGMKLDADPTVQYGIGYRDGAWWPSITIADYTTTASLYNTYLLPGLPPGPIANPSQSAIEAVIYPATSDYYYFRASCAGDGYHVFARTFEEHVANGDCGF